MYKECKELLKKNNQRENEISDKNQEIYTNMIVYLRGADITEYRQEQIREDIIEMILDGQERGDDIEQIMGGNYQEICDEILEEVPKRTKAQKILNTLHLGTLCIWILTLIFVVQNFITILGKGKTDYNITVTIGNLISWIIIVLIANGVVSYVCKTTFKEEKQRDKILENLVIIIGVVGIFAGIVLTNVFLTMPIKKMHIAIAVIIVVVIFLIDRMLATKDL